MIGQTITWYTANGPKTGVVEAKQPDGYFVRLASGKCVVVNEDSIRNGMEIHQRKTS